VERLTPAILVEVGDEVVEGLSNLGVLLTTAVLGSVGSFVLAEEVVSDLVELLDVLVLEVWDVLQSERRTQDHGRYGRRR